MNVLADNVVNTGVKNTVDITSENKSTNHIGNAHDWNLSEAEWNKYLQLKHGYQGYLFPHLTPPELLGYFAESDEERNHFAEIYARLEFSNVEKALKFNQAFHAASLRLYANVPLIKPFDITAYNLAK